MRAPTRDAVLATFEKYRVASGTAFDESHFFDYLPAAPKGKGYLRNSCRGSKRFSAFPFSPENRERAYSLDAFLEDPETAAVASRLPANTEESRKDRSRPAVLFIADAIFLAIAVIFRDTPWLAGGLVAAVVITVLFIRFAHKEKVRLRRLRARIEGAE